MENGYLQIAIWGGATVLGVVLLVTTVVLYRRRYRSAEENPRGSVWSPEDLSAMHHRGDLSEMEYAHLRDRALAQMGIERPSHD